MNSVIDPSLLAAYRQTHYAVHADPGFVLHIDEPSEALRALHRQQGTDSSAFITACNPRSERTDDSANGFRQVALEAEIRRRSLVCFPGMGQHPDNRWPGEPSFLVLGLTREAAKALGRRFGQNALLWSAEDAVPRLVLLR